MDAAKEFLPSTFNLIKPKPGGTSKKNVGSMNAILTTRELRELVEGGKGFNKGLQDKYGDQAMSSSVQDIWATTANPPHGRSPVEITVISMYRHDCDEMVRAIQHAKSPRVEVATVDAFQGREKPIILLHFVAADVDVLIPDNDDD
ncbi:Tripartite DNA replication factor [Coniosporium tulheliwenetii]|uniref:Tripartite DNA replication factor n=1 Tax=Coniosporium tulheliwenetii TaxID=3383036 RepID=A0ACC2YXM4_9PEZI|nr:Tripartite DNA replication factor [Cladosporium sp. JES 115]